MGEWLQSVIGLETETQSRVITSLAIIAAIMILRGLVQPWGGETAVLVWKGELAMVSFPTDEPLDNITRLKHINGNTFKRIRDDDELGEEIVFELDADGEVARLRRHSNVFPKVR